MWNLLSFPFEILIACLSLSMADGKDGYCRVKVVQMAIQPVELYSNLSLSFKKISIKKKTYFFINTYFTSYQQ